jgi:hypothetical protein
VRSSSRTEPVEQPHSHRSEHHHQEQLVGPGRHPCRDGRAMRSARVCGVRRGEHFAPPGKPEPAQRPHCKFGCPPFNSRVPAQGTRTRRLELKTHDLPLMTTQADAVVARWTCDRVFMWFLSRGCPCTDSDVIRFGRACAVAARAGLDQILTNGGSTVDRRI